MCLLYIIIYFFFYPSFPISLSHLSPKGPEGLKMIHLGAGALLWIIPKSCFEPGKVSTSLPRHPKSRNFFRDLLSWPPIPQEILGSGLWEGMVHVGIPPEEGWEREERHKFQLIPGNLLAGFGIWARSGDVCLQSRDPGSILRWFWSGFCSKSEGFTPNFS